MKTVPQCNIRYRSLTQFCVLQMMSPHVKLPMSRDWDYVTRHHLHVHVAICVRGAGSRWRQWKDRLPGRDSEWRHCSMFQHRSQVRLLHIMHIVLSFFDNP